MRDYATESATFCRSFMGKIIRMVLKLVTIPVIEVQRTARYSQGGFAP